MEHEMAKGTDREVMKSGLANFGRVVVNDFGKELEYSFVAAEKKWSTNEKNNTPANTTTATIQIENKTDYGLLTVLFDDTSGKILNVNKLDLKQPIPDMTVFWLVGIIFLCVPVFNIYVIRLVSKSNLRKKWLKYIAIFLLNIPSIVYLAEGSFTFKALYFQLMCGISFTLLGYANSTWAIGVPLGGIYWLWKLKRKRGIIEETQTIAPSSIPGSNILDLDTSKIE